MAWVQLTIDLDERHAEIAEAILHACGTSGLELRDGSTLPMPQVRAPKPGMAILVASFQDARGGRRAAAALRSELPASLRCVQRKVVLRDWSQSWKRTIRSRSIGQVWIGPPWLVKRAPAPKIPIVIEPGMAFGTGDHPTTALCVRALEAELQRVPKASVLDVGTGSGVLAIAAKKLGSGRTVAIDNDPVAVKIARANASANKVRGIAFSGRAVSVLEGRFAIVVANILAETLKALAPALEARTGRSLLLSGILREQGSDVASAFQKRGLQLAEERTEREWVLLRFERALR